MLLNTYLGGSSLCTSSLWWNGRWRGCLRMGWASPVLMLCLTTLVLPMSPSCIWRDITSENLYRRLANFTFSVEHGSCERCTNDSTTSFRYMNTISIWERMRASNFFTLVYNNRTSQWVEDACFSFNGSRYWMSY